MQGSDRHRVHWGKKTFLLRSGEYRSVKGGIILRLLKVNEDFGGGYEVHISCLEPNLRIGCLMFSTKGATPQLAFNAARAALTQLHKNFGKALEQ